MALWRRRTRPVESETSDSELRLRRQSPSANDSPSVQRPGDSRCAFSSDHLLALLREDANREEIWTAGKKTFHLAPSSSSASSRRACDVLSITLLPKRIGRYCTLCQRSSRSS